MSEVINLHDFKDNKRKEIEDRACEEFNILKINNDVFLIPEVTFVSHSEEVEDFKRELNTNIKDMAEPALAKAIDEITTEEGQTISIILKDVKDNGMRVVEIFNVANERFFVVETPIENDFRHRRIFTGLLASVARTKDTTFINYVLSNYEQVENIVEGKR